mmetsp:Transcript_22393/g.33093  ORF Transcript_22393/g.33093 Transcript_22393/m.33093 type:complete len:448 (-) Transcript_22393:98-1441(-)|eukprot:CAMPEP_0194253430 /NCGR_PEP_ID=MMETSP0158-20130606/29810_1 /TAXON_ID=33649 /ORGANISM="Thalassionema nitzschioides, Strain L26-B" /LENGTH=447 /DNA_ID=CAMNT_0038991115 /DNA_START=85 /DNA_END=1428 /DNA_ORIENTATION=-
MSTDNAAKFSESEGLSGKESKQVVVVTYEFTYSSFSGNGILARSLVKALLQLKCQVTVWCCKPHSDHCNGNNPLKFPEISKNDQQQLTVIPTQLSKEHGWRKLDDESAWESFIIENMDYSQQAILRKAIMKSDAIFPIDWTGSHALRSVADLPDKDGEKVPVIYLNFRVYSSGMQDDERKNWFNNMEKAAIDGASLVMALSECDKKSLETIASEAAKNIKIHILFPPLRGDMKDLSHLPSNNLEEFLPAEVSYALKGEIKQRRLLTCVARLSREKNVIRFVRFVEQAKVELDRLKIIPLLAGATADIEYATDVKRQLLEVAPNAVVVEHFLPPKSLASIFSRTVLNFHPCSYDAYGMTIVEAAACGAPSVLAKGGRVGASELVDSFVEVDMPSNESELSSQSVDVIMRHLKDSEKLNKTGEDAKCKAVAWDEEAYGKKILDIVRHQD